MNIALSPVAASLSERLGLILDDLRRAAAHHAGRNRAAAPIVLLLWSYLRRLGTRFDRMLAGGGRIRPARPSRTGTRTASPRLPGGFAWLLRLVPGIAAYGSQLEYLLADPDVARLLQQVPRAARMLKPLRFMLGQRDPLSSKPPSAAQPPQADPAPPTPALPAPQHTPPAGRFATT